MTKKEICENGSTIGIYTISNGAGLAIRKINHLDEVVYFYFASGDKKTYHKSKIYMDSDGLHEYFKRGKMKISFSDCLCQCC